MKNILVALDFNDGEKLLLEKAYELATAFKSKVWLLHVSAPDPDFISYEVGPQYIRDTRAEDLRKEHRQIQEYANSLKERNVDADGLLIQGATIEMVLEESEKLNIDLIITGHQEHGFLYEAFVGSVSSEIVKKSKMPVLVVPL